MKIGTKLDVWLFLIGYALGGSQFWAVLDADDDQALADAQGLLDAVGEASDKGLPFAAGAFLGLAAEGAGVRSWGLGARL